MKVNGVVYHFSLWSDLLTLVWVVGMMNIINFVDGVDGLAGGVSFIATIAIFLLSISIAVNQPAMASLTIILAGAILGFLFWNFPPAKIFMGDSGSMFLGFMLGVLPLISGGKLATVFLVLGFPIVDGLYVVITRLLRGKNPITAPDKTHLHHRFLRAGYSPRQAVLFLYAIAVLFAWVALQSTTMMKLVASVVLVVLIFLFIVLLNFIEKRKLRK
jgi:UDP-GlcNAc:undecaprenyl-phosphate GlcNAc-1-phosphate transferase